MGGKIEELAELTEQALVRVINEELGIEITHFLKLDDYEDVTLNGYHILAHGFK